MSDRFAESRARSRRKPGARPGAAIARRECGAIWRVRRSRPSARRSLKPPVRFQASSSGALRKDCLRLGGLHDGCLAAVERS